MWMKFYQRDLSIGEYGDYCDTCGRFEDECRLEMYNLHLGEHNLSAESETIICGDCAEKLKWLLISGTDQRAVV